MRPGKAFLFVFAGTLFGSGLAVSGMTDPKRVIGFLDVVGAWDPTLLFVMAGAAGSYGLGMLFLRHFTNHDLKLPATSSSPVNRRLVVGAAIFGAGWGLSGFCPGPAVANLAALRSEALVFVPSMLAGMFLLQKIFRADR